MQKLCAILMVAMLLAACVPFGRGGDPQPRPEFPDGTIMEVQTQ